MRQYLMTGQATEDFNIRDGEKGDEHIDVVDADKVVLDQDLAISRDGDG